MPYPSYKTTDQPWTPIIPNHWDFWRAKRIFYNPKEKNEGNKENNILSLTLRGVIHNNKENPIGLSPADYATYQIYETDDLAFKLIDLENISTSRVGIVPERGIMSSAYIRLSARGPVNVRYYYYQYHDWWLRQVYNGLGAGVRQTLSASELLNLKIAVPPLDEQDQIVNFLDWQTSRINKLIHGFQREILLIQERTESAISAAVLQGLNKDVKLKPTGLQNISYIPEHWEILQNKRIFEERSELSTTGNETLLSISKHYGVKPYAELSDSEQYATIKPAESLVGYKKVKRYDLAMNIMRARNGSYGVSDYDGIVSSAYSVFRPIIECNPRYMHHLLKTPHVIGIFESYSYGIAEHRRRLYAVDFLRLHLPVPPVEEQNEIAHYVEGLQEQAQSAIQKIQKEIDLLREYRTRLISDVVTGQMDVRGIKIPEYTMEEDAGDINEIDDIVDGEADTDAE